MPFNYAGEGRVSLNMWISMLPSLAQNVGLGIEVKWLVVCSCLSPFLTPVLCIG